jgi:plasmid stabilization system protein ParE
MTYEVRLTGGAYADLDRLTRSIAKDWPEGAERLTARFEEAIPRLESFPLACGLAYESRYFPEEVRHLLFQIRKGRSYRALFTVRGNTVYILAIRAPGERPPSPEELRG